MADLNDGLGLAKGVGGSSQPITSLEIGSERVQLEHFAGRMFRELLEQHGLVAATSCHRIGSMLLVHSTAVFLTT